MTRTVHLIVGPARHGVCQHGELIAHTLDHEIVRIPSPEEFDSAAVRGAEVVHLPYTDRLFAARCEDSAAAFSRIAKTLTAAGQAISVTLHDLPAGDSPLEMRRRAAYRRVVATARGVVVNSRRELSLLDQLDDHAGSRRRIPLPVLTASQGTIDPSTSSGDVEGGGDVVVLGFVFPDRGYEHTLAELPNGVDLLALGGPAAGHEDLPDQLAALASETGHSLRTTGYVADEDLPGRLAAAGIPVAPNRRVAASASIATWIGHGRRPLVPDSPYTRELATDWPGTVTLYDADQPGALRSAIDAARSDPARTHLAPGVAPGPALTDVAAAYVEHFEASAPDRLVEVGPGRWTVPGNRWDLLDDCESAEPPTVTVVIPYFEAQPQLDRVLAALTAQTHPTGRLQVVVADDGSTLPPDLSRAAALETVLVRQPDAGFRAAAARNLGAAAADGEVLLFLDGDTVPEPEYVQRLSRLPGLAPDTLAVGRRRHADFSQDPPAELDEPGWLVDAYRDSADLLHADERSYRYVISAVLGLHRDLFVELAGFGEEFTSYGGEDWELAHRAYAAGAVFAHVRDAVAWHDGPDWAGRADGPEILQKRNAEALALARLLPDPVARGGGQWLPYPAIVIRLDTSDLTAVLATARSAFASGADCGFWTADAAVVEMLGDPRVRAGAVPPDVLARASVVGDLVPADLSELPALAAAALTTGRLTTPAGVFHAARGRARSQRWWGSGELIMKLFGARDLAGPVPFGAVDLPHQLKKIYESSRRS